MSLPLSLSMQLGQWLLASSNGHDNILESVVWGGQCGDTRSRCYAGPPG